MLDVFKMKKLGIFAGGVLFGTAGIKLLSSKDAKKVYTECTAAVLRAKDCVMKTVTTVQENAEDIYAEAKQINEDRAAQAEEFEDEAVEDESFEKVTEENGFVASYIHAGGKIGVLVDVETDVVNDAIKEMAKNDLINGLLIRA